MTNRELADGTRQALAEFARLSPDEKVNRLIAAGIINKHGEALMDPPLYQLCEAAVAMAATLRQSPNSGNFQTNGSSRHPDRAGAADDLQRALTGHEKNLRKWGDTPDDRIKRLGLTGGPAWRRKMIAKIIKAQSLAQEGKDSDALNWFGQAAWEYRDALPGNAWLEGEIERIWPTRPADDTSLDSWVC